MLNSLARHEERARFPGFASSFGAVAWESSAFPGSEQIALVIHSSSRKMCLSKPPPGFIIFCALRRFHANQDARLSNLLVAAALSWPNGRSPEQLKPILEEEDIKQFVFRPRGNADGEI